MSEKSNKIAFAVFIISVVLLLILGNGHRGGPNSSMADVRTSFKEVIENYDEQRGKMKEVFDDGKTSLLNFKEAIRAAKDKYAEFGKVYDRWEYVDKEIAKLKLRYQDLVEGAEKFYSKLEARANSITDADLRTSSLKSLNAHKDKYYIRLRETEDKIELLNGGVVKVSDTVKALEINYTLNVVDETIYQTFQEIDSMISEVMPELEKLTEESKELLLAIK